MKAGNLTKKTKGKSATSTSRLHTSDTSRHAMKGVTPIVAIIILLLITIALAGAAYTYLSGYFQGLTGKVMQMQDFQCIAKTGDTYDVKIIFKNIGTQTTTLCSGSSPVGANTSTPATCGDFTITKSGNFGTNLNYTITPTEIGAGGTTTFTDKCAAGVLCLYRFVTAGTALGAITPAVQC